MASSDDMAEILVRVRARNMPSVWCREHGISHLGISRAKQVVDAVPTEESGAVYELTVDVVTKPEAPDGIDFRGPYVFGRKGERFLYLNWGCRTDDGWTSGTGGGRIKLQLLTIDATLIESALAGGVLLADLDLSNETGGPVYATVRAPRLTWQITS
jgi:Family of unknown function (DUF5990)